MKKCHYCGRENVESDQFCHECGSSLTQDPPVDWKRIRPRISQVSLFVYVALWVSSGCVLGVAGDYWQMFLVMGFVACIPIFAGPVHYRVVGAFAVVFALLLAKADINSGKKWQEKMHQILTNPHSRP